MIRSLRGRSTAILLCVISFSTAMSTAQAVSYHLTDLGVPGFRDSGAMGINNVGQVVGHATFSDVSQGSHAFLYSDGVMQDLGTLGGSDSVAFSVNSSGHVVGRSTVTANWTYHAFEYSNGVMRDLGTLGGTSSEAWSINDSGIIVGQATENGESTQAFRYANGVMTALDTPMGSGARGINARGDIIGYFNAEIGVHPFLIRDDVFEDLGTLGTTNQFSFATAINNVGQITGYGGLGYAGEQHAFLYSSGQMTDLGVLIGTKSFAFGLNNWGDVVGKSASAASEWHAVLYKDGAIVDLNTALDSSGSGWILTEARGINDLGWIVGSGRAPNGVDRGFLLRPLPEPGLVFLGCLTLGFGRRCRGRRRSVI